MTDVAEVRDENNNIMTPSASSEPFESSQSKYPSLLQRKLTKYQSLKTKKMRLSEKHRHLLNEQIRNKKKLKMLAGELDSLKNEIKRKEVSLKRIQQENQMLNERVNKVS